MPGRGARPSRRQTLACRLLGQSLPTSFGPQRQDVTVASIPCHDKLFAGNFPFTLLADQAVAVVAAQREPVVAVRVGEEVLGLDVDDDVSYVVIDRDERVIQTMLSRVQAGEKRSAPLYPVVGSEPPGGTRAVRAVVEINFVSEDVAVRPPVPHVDSSSEPVQGSTDGQFVGWIRSCIRHDADLLRSRE